MFDLSAACYLLHPCVCTCVCICGQKEWGWGGGGHPGIMNPAHQLENVLDRYRRNVRVKAEMDITVRGLEHRHSVAALGLHAARSGSGCGQPNHEQQHSHRCGGGLRATPWQHHAWTAYAITRLRHLWHHTLRPAAAALAALAVHCAAHTTGWGDVDALPNTASRRGTRQLI